MGLDLSDLSGDLTEVEIVDVQNSQKSGSSILIITGTHEGRDCKFGVIGKVAIDSFLSHGTKREDGTLVAEVPGRIISQTSEGKVQWLNFEY